MRHGVPKVIYLQICNDADCNVPYDDHDGITWCSHRIDKTDVKYVLAKDKPQRTWVGLTDDEVARLAHHELWVKTFIRKIEEKLRSKNT